MTMSIYARLNLVDFLDAGYGSAVSTLLMLLIGLITIAYVRLAGLRL
jgi:ABC-type sugar transport system permease subunit